MTYHGVKITTNSQISAMILEFLTKSVNIKHSFIAYGVYITTKVTAYCYDLEIKRQGHIHLEYVQWIIT